MLNINNASITFLSISLVLSIITPCHPLSQRLVMMNILQFISIYIAFFLFTSVILLLQDSLTALTFGTGVCSHVCDLMPVEFVGKEKTIFVLKF